MNWTTNSKGYFYANFYFIDGRSVSFILFAFVWFIFSVNFFLCFSGVRRFFLSNGKYENGGILIKSTCFFFPSLCYSALTTPATSQPPVASSADIAANLNQNQKVNWVVWLSNWFQHSWNVFFPQDSIEFLIFLFTWFNNC